jgi:membrane protease YdiL (CAAX protease family)
MVLLILMHERILQATKAIKTTRWELFLQIILVFILPIFFIQSGYVLPTDRVYVLVALVTILTIILFIEKWRLPLLGVHPITKKHLLAYTIFTLIGVLVIIGFGDQIGQVRLVQWWHYPHFIYLFFVVSFFQEVAYRGYLIPALGKLSSTPAWIILANTVLFTLLHTIFPNQLVGLPLAFVGGIGFSVMYLKYPNLVLIILSHAILNFFAVLYGFFVIPGVTY